MVRPDVFIVYDELQAPEPSEFSWVLNTFEPPQIDEQAHSMIVSQGDQRLRVRHLAPSALSYTQNNERPFPMLTKSFCRYTEAFPQPYNIRVTTSEKSAAQEILAVMDTYSEAAGPQVSGVERVAATDGLAVRYTRDGMTETVLLRPRGADLAAASAGGVETDARLVSVGRDADGRVVRWLMHDGTRLVVDGVPVFSSQARCDASGSGKSAACAARLQVKHAGPLQVSFPAPQHPRTVHAAPPGAPSQGAQLPFSWADGRVSLELPQAGETVLWVDPAAEVTSPPQSVALAVTDSEGAREVELETAVADNGDTIAFGCLDPREPGLYDFTATGEGTELLVQDRWDMPRSASGKGAVRAPWREGTEVFIRFRPGERPQVRATLARSYRGELVNLLRNGSFEEGSPGYPPRTWTISHPRKMGFTWPFWSQEDAAEGRSCLKFVRPEIAMSLISQPMRLRTAGKYVLRFLARGNATQAAVSVSGQRGTGGKIAVQPSEDWKEYVLDVQMERGYTTVAVSFAAGGEPDQVLWMDDVRFGYVAE